MTESKQVDVQLARCPFCDFSPIMTSAFCAAMVHCPTCGADGPMKDTKSEAASAWNHRPALAACTPAKSEGR